MARVSDTNPPSYLTNLPEELGLAIIEELDMASIFALSETYRQFHRLANPADASRRSKLEEFLLEAQDFRRWSRGYLDKLGDGFACFSCAKILPRNNFSQSQTTSTRRQHAARERQMGRFCIPCGVSKNLYGPGSWLVQGEEVRFVCRGCKELRGGEFCKRCAVCRHCDHEGVALKRCEEEGRFEGHEVLRETARMTISETVSSGALACGPPTLRVGISKEVELSVWTLANMTTTATRMLEG